MMLRYMLPMLLFVAAIPLSAQEDVLYPYPGTFPLNLGVELGPNFSLFSQGVGHSPIDNPTSPYRTLKSGSGLGGLAALQLELPINSTMGIQARAGFELKRFTSIGEGVADCPTNSSDLLHRFDTVDLSIHSTAQTAYATAGIFLRGDVGGNFFVTIGPVAHWWLGKLTFSNRLEILSPGTCVFNSTGTKVAETESSDDQGLAETRFGLEGGIGYRIELSKKLWLAPALRFQYMLTPFAPDGIGGVDAFRHTTLGDLNLSFTNRALHAVNLGISLWWHP